MVEIELRGTGLEAKLRAQLRHAFWSITPATLPMFMGYLYHRDIDWDCFVGSNIDDAKNCCTRIKIASHFQCGDFLGEVIEESYPWKCAMPLSMFKYWENELGLDDLEVEESYGLAWQRNNQQQYVLTKLSWWDLYSTSNPYVYVQCINSIILKTHKLTVKMDADLGWQER